MTGFIDIYFKALETEDYKLMLSLFASNAVVSSPLYGELKARDFYKNLFSQTSKSKIKVLEVYKGDKPYAFATHFIYSWLLKNNELVEFECIDVFYTNDKGKIAKLVIIYDAKEAREKAGLL